MLAAFGFRLRRVRSYGLVGRSGTGKSFRAGLVAEKRDIDLIIDDGLIIRDGTILFGDSAKKEPTLMSAVRRAVFDDPGQAAEARLVLWRERCGRVLVVGTSDQMVHRILRNLALPLPREILRITEVASAQEIDAAGRTRRVRGAHSLPLPPVSIRLGIRSAIGGKLRSMRLRMLRSRRRRPPAVVAEASSAGTRRGEVVFTEAALGQMVQHCVQEFDDRLFLNRLTIDNRGALYSLEVRLGIPFGGMPSGKLHELREYLVRSLEKHAGVLVENMTLIVERVGDTAPA